MELPKYEQLKERLRTRILHGELRPGDRLPSETALMIEHGCSRYTVRQAVGDLVTEGWLDRKHGSGTFVCPQGAGPRRPALVGVVTTYISEYIFPSIVRGIERSLSERGYGVLLASTDNRRESEPACLELMLSHNVAGLIIEPAQSALPNPDLRPYRELIARSIPFVMLHGTYPGLVAPSVTVDDFAGAYQLADHLIGLGHSEIAAIVKGDDVQGVERERGVVTALRDHGITPRPEWLCHYTTCERETCGAEFVQQMLTSRPRPTALYCYNDQIALQVMQALEEAGLRVPDHMSVVGFDDSPLLATTKIPLTTAAHPKEEMGREAAQLLYELLEGGSRRYHRSVRYLPGLVVRSSTARIASPVR
jgi:GntR family transcriptional regulator, arabinose operon transcriptional repressor